MNRQPSFATNLDVLAARILPDYEVINHEAVGLS